ncbi:IS630 family transposase [Rhodoferax sp.]|uniref:IS630 family transposase n=1 Tax=Rhodoferax sp. TaxID=50421 RepID=UPI0039B9727E
MNSRRVVVEFGEDDLETLLRWSTSSLASVRCALRANMVLMAAAGFADRVIAQELAVSAPRVRRWVARYVKLGLKGLEKDAPRGGRPRLVSAQRVIELTTQTQPEAATQWSTRTMAKEAGASAATISRIWRSHGLKPHLSKTFKVSNDIRFEEKLTDIVGLYMNPPERAVVLCCDEKSQVQALDRTQPGLPLKRGRAQTMTHDYKRHGTTTLFAALNILDGSVISQCQPRHRHIEWLKFLKQIDTNVAPDLQIHVVLDNYATHKHPKVLQWLAKRPRFHMHFTATSASWMNMVERFFRNLSEDRLKRGVFRSVDELIDAINLFVLAHNENPKPFIWTASARDILEKVMRAKAKLNTVQIA